MSCASIERWFVGTDPKIPFVISHTRMHWPVQRQIHIHVADDADVGLEYRHNFHKYSQMSSKTESTENACEKHLLVKLHVRRSRDRILQRFASIYSDQ